MRSSTIVTTFSRLEIHALPSGKAVAVEKAIRVDGTTVFLGKDGKLYCPRIKAGVYYGIGCLGYIDSVLGALQKLGIATKEQIAQHKAEINQREAEDVKRYALADLNRMAKKFGLKIPASERAKLKPARRRKAVQP